MADGVAGTSHLGLIGEIEGTEAETLVDGLEDAAAGSRLWLNSPGGDERASLLIAQTVRRQGMTTHVAEGGMCNSACTVTFAAGTERHVHGAVRFGFHQVTWNASDYRGDDPITPNTMAADIGSQAQAVSLLLLRHFNDMGVDASVLGYMLSQPKQQANFPALEDLISRRFVTHVHPRAETMDERLRTLPSKP